MRSRKRRTWDSLIELTYTGSAADWKKVRRVVDEARGATLIQGALRSVRAVLRARIIGDQPTRERAWEMWAVQFPVRVIE